MASTRNNITGNHGAQEGTTVTYVHEHVNGRDFYSMYSSANNGTQEMVREELKRACMGKYRRLMDILHCCHGDLRENLMFLLQVVLCEIDEAIYNKINQLRDAATQMRAIDKGTSDAEPGKLPGLNTETSVIQTELTMLVQRRQQIVDTINNAIKSVHDSDMNTVRRIV